MFSSKNGYRRYNVKIGNHYFRVQGYERIALREMVNVFGIDPSKIECRNCPPITYIEDGKIHIYHPDFYLPDNNALIEIKSDYTLVGQPRWFSRLLAKRHAAISAGYKFFLVVYNKREKRINLPLNWHLLDYSTMKRLVKSENIT